MNGDEGPELHYFAVKTTSKQERTVADNIRKAVEQSDIKVYSVMAPKELQGYVLIETPEEFARMEQLSSASPTPAPWSTARPRLPRSSTSWSRSRSSRGSTRGRSSSLIAGPFKGEKAVVKRVDTGKEEITVELYESVVPIPITVRGDNVRVIDNSVPED